MQFWAAQISVGANSVGLGSEQGLATSDDLPQGGDRCAQRDGVIVSDHQFAQAEGLLGHGQVGFDQPWQEVRRGGVLDPGRVVLRFWQAVDQRFARIQVALVGFEVATAVALGGPGKSLAPTRRREVAPQALDASAQPGIRFGYKRANDIATSRSSERSRFPCR